MAQNPSALDCDAMAEAAFHQGFALHRESRAEEAQRHYERVLELQPEHVNALHLLGVLALERDDPKRAAELIGKAVLFDPANASAHVNLGTAQQLLNQPQRAVESFDRALALRPELALAHYNRGNSLRLLGNPRAALASYDSALALDPRYVDALHNRALALSELGRHREALAPFGQAIALKPDYAQAYFNRGNEHRHLEDWPAAIADYDRAIAFQPDYWEAHLNRGAVLRRLGRLEEALESCDRAVAVSAARAEAYSNRGALLADLDRHDAALEDCAQALRLDPDHAQAHVNSATVLRRLGRIDEALESCDRAIAAGPQLPEAHSNRGVMLAELNRLDDALAEYDRAIALKPDYGGAHFNRGLLWLLKGRFDRGFSDYEWRWRDESGTLMRERREFSRPRWMGGESLSGRTILVHAEQGLGDTLQFCRYVPLLARRGARVILEVQEPLRELLKGLSGVWSLRVRGEELGGFDCWTPLMSLPLALGTRVETIPAEGAYLKSEGRKVERFRERLGGGAGLKVGLVWSGRAEHRNDHNRSIGLSELMRYLPAGVRYVSLQKEVREADRGELAGRAGILRFEQELVDFSDTAGLVECLDVVISVDTSVAHLAGAMGKRVWVLLPWSADWRWLQGRADSPWYPTARLYRQSERAEWRAPLERLASDLRALAGERP